jgi:chorismate lyase / 3-hydroxybenzoate synthase
MTPPAVEGVIVPASALPQDTQTKPKLLPSLSLQYAREFTPGDDVLGVVGFGAARPAGLPSGCPFIRAPLTPAGDGPAYEVWRAASPVRHCSIGAVQGACSADLAFGAVALEETVPLEDAVERAYLGIFAFLAQTGLSEPIRFWNYLADILGDERGLERYRRFNIGRHRAFLAHLRQPVPPAASGVGGHKGASVIYFLAGRVAAQAIENPRQVSAYDYPPQYGPRSPSFSRAGLFGDRLFISGTASIVGHETRHGGDWRGQLAETLENLRALIAAAGLAAARGQGEDWALKIYIRDPSLQAGIEPALTAIFGAGSQRLYLQGEICRADLVLEIEAFYRGA